MLPTSLLALTLPLLACAQNNHTCATGAGDTAAAAGVPSGNITSNATVNPQGYVLEKPALQVCANAAAGPPLWEGTPEQARQSVAQLQQGPVQKAPASAKWVDIPAPEAKRAGAVNDTVRAKIIYPHSDGDWSDFWEDYEDWDRRRALIAKRDHDHDDDDDHDRDHDHDHDDRNHPRPVILYTHGGGWVFGDADIFDRYVRDLAFRTGYAVVFPEYTLAPEAHYPVQNEQAFAAAKWVRDSGRQHGLDRDRMAVVGDSAGGNMALALNIMAGQRPADNVTFKAAVVTYPVTNASFDSPSYTEFADGYYLARRSMQWFWDQYIPANHTGREESTASPLRATLDEVKHFPPTLVITDECDVLRDEGEAFAAKLRAAEVNVTAVRYQGMIHDFMMLNALGHTEAYKAAINQIANYLKRHVQTWHWDGDDHWDHDGPGHQSQSHGNYSSHTNGNN